MIEIFKKKGILTGRMVGYSKSTYRFENPNNLVVFNANIFAKNEDGEFVKVWYGDLDLTKDFEALKEISSELDKTLYVLREMDGKFENETTQNVVSKSVWDTTKDKPFIESKTTKDTNVEDSDKDVKDLKIISDNNINNSKVVNKLDIPFEEIEYKINKLEEKIKSFGDLEDYDNWENFNEYKEEHLNDFISLFILGEYIKKELKVEEDKQIKVTHIYVREDDNEKLRELDKKMLKLFEPILEDEKEESYNFRIDKDINWLYFSSGPAVIFKKDLDIKGIDINSYEKGKVYLIEGFEV